MNVLDKIVSFSQNRSLIIAYGDHDPPEFHRQSREMAEVSLIRHKYSVPNIWCNTVSLHLYQSDLTGLCHHSVWYTIVLLANKFCLY